MNSVTAQHPLQNTPEGVFLRFCLSVSALIPIASHSRFVCAGFPFSEWAIGLRAIIEIDINKKFYKRTATFSCYQRWLIVRPKKCRRLSPEGLCRVLPRRSIP